MRMMKQIKTHQIGTAEDGQHILVAASIDACVWLWSIQTLSRLDFRH